MERIRESLKELESANLYRRLKTVEHRQGANIVIDKKKYILLSSNDYLGLAADVRIVNAAKRSLDEYGFGSGASRLISGTMNPHTELEEVIARFKGTERAILFNSGYSANIGLISALATRNDIILSDKLNHASIVDAALMSRAEMRRYPHKDVTALERFLKKSGGYLQRIIVTDSLFSMDGDIAPLRELIELSKRYDAYLIIDDAHATGVIGEGGKGTLSHLGLDDDNVIQMGTLSKALGCFGAFVACKTDLVEYLINKSRSFIYTTALPMANASAAIEAIKIARDADELREKLFDNVEYLRGRLIDAGFDILNTESHIIPLVIGDADDALSISRYLFDNGVFIQAIRPPTVPKGTCRLRITPTALHTKEELEHVSQLFIKYREGGDGQ